MVMKYIVYNLKIMGLNPSQIEFGGVGFPSKLNWKQQIQWNGFYEVCWQS